MNYTTRFASPRRNTGAPTEVLYYRTWHATLPTFSYCKKPLTLTASLVELKASIDKGRSEATITSDSRPLRRLLQTSAVLSTHHHSKKIRQNNWSAQGVDLKV